MRRSYTAIGSASLEATEVDDRLIELFHGNPARLAPYLHAPLQSGSDRVLKRMGRNWYTAASYARAIEKVVRGQSAFGLGADVIAGFPGETDDDHRETIALIESLPFTSLHVFPYSARPGTAAPKMSGAVPAGVISERARELRAIGARKAEAYRASRIGGPADVAVIKAAARDALGQGLTGDYLTVAIRDASLERGARFPATLSVEDGVMLADNHERLQ